MDEIEKKVQAHIDALEAATHWSSTSRRFKDALLAGIAALRAAPAAAGVPVLHWERDHGDRESARLYGWHFETVYERYSGGKMWHVSVRYGDCDDWTVITERHTSPEQAKIEASEWVRRETAVEQRAVPEEAMFGRIIEANFIKNTLTLEMEAGYRAFSGRVMLAAAQPQGEGGR